METLKRTKFEEQLSPLGIRYFRSMKAVLGAEYAKNKTLLKIKEGAWKFRGDFDSSTPISY